MLVILYFLVIRLNNVYILIFSSLNENIIEPFLSIIVKGGRELINLQVKNLHLYVTRFAFFILQLCVNTFLSACTDNRTISYLLQHGGWGHDYYFYFILPAANICELQMLFSGFKLPFINMKWIIISLPENCAKIHQNSVHFHYKLLWGCSV